MIINKNTAPLHLLAFLIARLNEDDFAVALKCVDVCLLESYTASDLIEIKKDFAKIAISALLDD